MSALLCAMPVTARDWFDDGTATERWNESAFELPAPPSDSSLRRFFVSAASPNDFYVDEASLEVGEDGVIRYVLVIRTPGGAENVTFEGIRCASAERRLYAIGQGSGEWVDARRSEWEPIRANNYNMPRAALAANYVCDGPAPPRNRAEALRWLRYGAPRHPDNLH